MPLRDVWFPHAGNNHHPRIVHGRRLAGYAAALTAMKAVLVVAILALPSAVFLSDASFRSMEEAIVAGVNDARDRAGLAPLVRNAALEQSAAARAVDLVSTGYFGHVGPQGQTLDTFLHNARYPYAVAGENLAMGFTNPRAVIAAWLRSPTHRANVLAEDFTDIGVGIAGGTVEGRSVLTVVEHGGRRSSTAATIAQARSILDPDGSFASWAVDGSGGTRVTVRVRSREPLRDAQVSIVGTVVPLEQEDTNTAGATVTIAESPERLFAVTVPPDVQATTVAGVTVREPIRWERPFIPSTRLGARYAMGRAYLEAIGAPVLGVSRAVFGFALTVFAFLLALSIATELGRAHPHVVQQTVLLVGMLIMFLLV